uniref:Uncharacterized protein n=1 Tax=Anguilla anguilla TaxID=7936 RepID=A0A0E9QHN4_ANGAN
MNHQWFERCMKPSLYTAAVGIFRQCFRRVRTCKCVIRGKSLC